ncbi:hypothetical protein Tco_1150836 [Tanacetum coccineum]
MGSARGTPEESISRLPTFMVERLFCVFAGGIVRCDTRFWPQMLVPGMAGLFIKQFLAFLLGKCSCISVVGKSHCDTRFLLLALEEEASLIPGIVNV